MPFPDLNTKRQSTQPSPEPGLRERKQPKDRYKRWFDIAALLIVHLLFAPIWIVIWTAIPLAIWLGDRQSVFYTQIRVGKNGKNFRMIKFRTMVIDAEQKTGPIWSSDQDRRVTVVGKLLRRFRLDEMPQVINIIRNEMSLVGPRPCLFNQEELIVARETKKVFAVRPGVTGLSQVQGIDMSTPKLLADTDAQMIKNLTLSNYFRYLLLTFIGRGSGDRAQLLGK